MKPILQTALEDYVISNEALFGLFKSRPKLDYRKPKETSKLIKETLLNNEWLGKQKFQEKPVKISYPNSLAPDIQKAWNDYQTEAKNWVKKVQSEIDQYLIPFKEIQKKLENNTFTKADIKTYRSKVDRVFEFTQFKFKNSDRNTTIAPLNKDQLKQASDLYLKLLNSSDEKEISFTEQIDQFCETDWYGYNSKYRSLLNQLDDDPDEDDEFGVFGIICQDNLLEMSSSNNFSFENTNEIRKYFIRSLEDYILKSLK